MAARRNGMFSSSAVLGQLPRKQPVFKPLELGFPRGAERRRRRAAARTVFRTKISPIFLSFSSCFSFHLVFVQQTKNPRLTGNRGFLKFFVL